MGGMKNEFQKYFDVTTRDSCHRLRSSEHSGRGGPFLLLDGVHVQSLDAARHTHYRDGDRLVDSFIDPKELNQTEHFLDCHRLLFFYSFTFCRNWVYPLECGMPAKVAGKAEKKEQEQPPGPSGSKISIIKEKETRKQKGHQ